MQSLGPTPTQGGVNKTLLHPNIEDPLLWLKLGCVHPCIYILFKNMDVLKINIKIWYFSLLLLFFIFSLNSSFQKWIHFLFWTCLLRRQFKFYIEFNFFKVTSLFTIKLFCDFLFKGLVYFFFYIYILNYLVKRQVHWFFQNVSYAWNSKFRDQVFFRYF